MEKMEAAVTDEEGADAIVGEGGRRCAVGSVSH